MNFLRAALLGYMRCTAQVQSISILRLDLNCSTIFGSCILRREGGVGLDRDSGRQCFPRSLHVQIGASLQKMV